jgi:hypothetical protein
MAFSSVTFCQKTRTVPGEGAPNVGDENVFGVWDAASDEDADTDDAGGGGL